MSNKYIPDNAKNNTQQKNEANRVYYGVDLTKWEVQGQYLDKFLHRNE